MIQYNPFTSQSFINIWCQHFNKDKDVYKFSLFEGISFFKPTFLQLYINTGKNLTKGVSYKLNTDSNNTNLKNKIFLIYDVPEYFNIETNCTQKNLKVIKVKQYSGVLTDFKKYSDFNDYLLSTFSKKSRYKFKSYEKNLEKNFQISYSNYFGAILKEDYNIVFEEFYNLLKKRFEEKHETNNNLNPEEWNFYFDSTYQLILEKKASLFVIYSDSKPIAISLNYFSENIIFFAMTVFDIDYYAFNIGKVHLMKLYEWCFNEKNIKIFDLSKGDYDYKKRWGNLSYNFEYHIYYDSSSLKTTFMAKLISFAFKLKQYLRDNKFNDRLHKLSFLLKNLKSRLE